MMPFTRRSARPAGSTRRVVPAALAIAVATWAGPVRAQAPDIRNGRVDPRQTTSIASAVAAVSGGADAVWIGWLVPRVASDHQLCTQWAPALGEPEITALEPASMPARPPHPVRLEGGTNLVLLIRVTGGSVERLRTLDDECPIDAGGRAVHWLTAISAEESLRFLGGLIRTSPSAGEARRHVAGAAVAAIALHRDAAADPVLDLLVTPGTTSPLVREAAMWLGTARGVHGFETLRTRIAATSDPAWRRTFVRALGQTRQPQTAESLRSLARTDPDAGVRVEAVQWYAARAADGALTDLLAIIEQDPDDAVKRRAVSSLGSLAADTGVPALIRLAEAGPSSLIRKEAVRTLGRLTDGRARAFLERVVAR